LGVAYNFKGGVKMVEIKKEELIDLKKIFEEQGQLPTAESVGLWENH